MVNQDFEWLNTAETATMLGVTPRTLYRFIDEGKLPAYRFGRVIRLRADEVVKFIDQCRIEPGSLGVLDAEHAIAEANRAKSAAALTAGATAEDSAAG